EQRAKQHKQTHKLRKDASHLPLRIPRSMVLTWPHAEPQNRRNRSPFGPVLAAHTSNVKQAYITVRVDCQYILYVSGSSNRVNRPISVGGRISITARAWSKHARSR